jgi:heme-degrading monooxygenase HmoA
MSNYDKFLDAFIDHMEDIHQLPRGFLRNYRYRPDAESYAKSATLIILENEQAVRDWVKENITPKLLDDFLKSVGEGDI